MLQQQTEYASDQHPQKIADQETERSVYGISNKNDPERGDTVRFGKGQDDSVGFMVNSHVVTALDFSRNLS